MKKALTMIIAVVMLTAFTLPDTTKHLTGDVVELPGYKLKGTTINLSDFNLWVVMNDVAFTKDFEPMHDNVAKPGFERDMVLAARVQTVNHIYKVKFKKTETTRDGILNVYFNVKKERPGEVYTGEMSMVVVPKDAALKKVTFYHDGMPVKSVPIVTVY
jgi:hypothetical protein